jgi:beta-glucosidase/6-phospho-beta-glucosidase/beta-galactosidase
MVPIVDLCHFGVPDWIGNFQNPDFPALFADYAGAFAERYPWVQLYTPINEMSICALFSALYGWWNEQGTTDRTFVTALKHIVKANVLAMQRDPEGAAATRCSSRANRPNTSTPINPAAGRPRSSERAASCRWTSTTAAASTRRCTST